VDRELSPKLDCFGAAFVYCGCASARHHSTRKSTQADQLRPNLTWHRAIETIGN